MALAELSPDGKRINVDTQFREKDLIKTVPGAKWDSKERTWYCNLSWAACLQLRGTFGQDLQVGVALASWAKDQLVWVRKNRALREENEGPDIAGMPAGLYGYQKAGTAFMITAGCALNADEMGTGKTVQTIAALEILGAYPALIVCPNSVKDTWAKDEFPKWAPHRKVVAIGGSMAERRKAIERLRTGSADVGIINYEAFRLHSRIAGYGNIRLDDKEKEPKELNRIKFKALVADEAHRIKNPRAKMTRAVWAVGEGVENRFALTGTPVANAPDDLWAIMRFTYPLEWPTKTGFIDRYALQSWGGFGFQEAVGIRVEMKPELFGFLDPRMIRRTKAQVLPWLPEKISSTVHVDLTGKQKTAYEAMRKQMVVELKSGILVATNALAKLVRLMQFASAYGEIEEINGKDMLRLSEPSNKVDALLELVESLGGAPAVIFAESKQLVDLGFRRLVKGGYKVGAITGGVTEMERTLAKNEFQAGNLQLLCCTMAAGGVGLNLTAAEAEIFMQGTFNFVNRKQAEERAHRPGQKNALQIIDIITTGTVDVLPHEAIQMKGLIAEDIVRDAPALERWLAKGGPKL